MDRKEMKEKWMDDSTDFLKNIFQEIEKICNDLNLNNYEDDIAARSTVEFLAEWLRFLDGKCYCLYKEELMLHKF